MKYVNIKWDENFDMMTRSIVEQLLSAWSDFGYGYDIEDEALERQCEALDDIGLDYEIEEEDDL